MSDLVRGPSEEARLAAIRDDLASVSTATACHLLITLGWRNAYMCGLMPLQELGLGTRLVGRARTGRYLMRRGPEGPRDPVARRVAPEIVVAVVADAAWRPSRMTDRRQRALRRKGLNPAVIAR